MVLEKTLQSPLDCKEIQPVHQRRSVLGVHWKVWCWSWNSNTLAIRWEELTHLKIPWFWERLRAGGEGDDRGWDGWMASSTQWTWVWINSGSWWWTGRPGMLRLWGFKERDTTGWLNELKIKQCNISSVILPSRIYKVLYNSHCILTQFLQFYSIQSYWLTAS